MFDEIIIKLRVKYPDIKQLRSLSKGQIIRASIKPIIPQLNDLLENDHTDIDILKLLDL